MKSRRLSNWPRLLEDFIAEQRNQPFAWGERDCCLFASNCVRVITGIDPAEQDFRGRYSDATGAMRLVREHGGVEAIAEMQCARLGFPELASVALAQRGDVMLTDTSVAGPACGICVGANSAFVGPEGINFIPTADCRRAWRVI